MGETTSYDASYSGVKPLAWANLPLIAKQDKLTILGGSECPSPSAGHYDASRGMPLFCEECKPQDFLTVLLKEWMVEYVVDLSPGTGCLARACMTEGWQYVGLCRTNEHSSWLRNIVDRRALEVLASTGTALYEQDLAGCIRDHFKEVLEELHDQDVAVDEGTFSRSPSCEQAHIPPAPSRGKKARVPNPPVHVYW